MRKAGAITSAIVSATSTVLLMTSGHANMVEPGEITHSNSGCTGPSIDGVTQCLTRWWDEVSGCGDAPRFGNTYLKEGPTYDGVHRILRRYNVHRWLVSRACWDYYDSDEHVWHSGGIYLLADGAECVPGNTFDTVDASCDFDGPSNTLEAPPAPCIINESNPCNPADGSKTEVEVDYDPGSQGALRFARYYNSVGPYKTAANFPTGWRHTYARVLDETPDRRPSIKYPAAANQSSFYATPSEACETGWGDILTGVWGGDLSTATASFVGGNTCKVQSGSSVVYMPVRSGIPRTSFTQASTIKTITRPNGSVVVFELDAGTWSSSTHPNTILEDTGTSWVYTDTNDTQETYNLDGRLVSIEYRNGQTEQLEYNLTTGQGGDENDTTLDRVTGPFGHTIVFSRHVGSGRLESITTPDGTISYDYGSHGSLRYVWYPGNKYREYLYEDADLPHHLTGIIDENRDRYASWQYDDAGRAIVSEHAGGQERVEFAYNTNGTTTLTLANGSTRTYDFSVQQGSRKIDSLTGMPCMSCPDGDIRSRTYDANGYLDEATDWNGNVTKTTRDSRGLITTLTEAKGTTEQRITTYEWHPSFRLPTKVTTPRNVTDYVYDADGNPTSITVSGGGKSRAWAFTYNSHGQVLTINGPRSDVSDVTTLAYYTCTTGAECGQLQSVTNALSHVTTFDSYDASGRLTQMIDPNGLITAYAYDGRGRLLTVTQTPIAGTARVTTMTYDATGQLKTLTVPDGRVLIYSYDAAHNLTSVADNFGNRIEYGYDAMGNLTDEDSYDPGSVLKRAMDYAYDLNNRLDTVTNGGFSTDLTLDLVGNLTGETDPNTNATQHTYDALNRLEQTIDALSGIVSYNYDDHDNLTQVATPNGATTTFAYDQLDNLLSETSPDRGIITYTYDDAGNRLTATDARSVTGTYVYDALNRPISISYPNTVENVTFTYDDAATNGIGWLRSIDDQAGTITYTYNEFGEVVTDQRQIGAFTYTTSYQYDAVGNVSSVTYPSGRTVTYGRNAIGEVTQVTSDMGGILNTVAGSASYDPFGPLSGLTYGNGIVVAYPRRTDYRITSVIAPGVFDKTYSYDLAGNLTDTIDVTGSASSRSYGYDGLNRLTSEASVNSSAYSAAVLADAPKAYWRVSEVSGTVAVDATGNGADGTYAGTVELRAPSLVSGGDTSMGINTQGAGYLTAPAMVGVSLTAVEAWFQTDSISAHRDIVSIHNTDYNRILIYHRQTDGYIAVWQGLSGNVLVSDAAHSVGQPHHVALWYEPASNTTYLMIDGVTQQGSYSGNLLAINNPQVLVGAYKYNGVVYSRALGGLDEIAIYDGAVDASTFADRVSETGISSASSFIYDANGNRTVLDAGTTTNLSYQPLSNRLSAIDGIPLQHDVAGNRTADLGGTRTFSYNDAGRLSGVVLNGSPVASYTYNALGQRTTKTVGAVTTVYLYDVFGHLLGEHDQSGGLIRDYVWLDELPVAQIDAGEVFSYLHVDHLGTPRVATDASQTIVWRWEGDAFGSTAASEDPDGDLVATTINLRFPGQYV